MASRIEGHAARRTETVPEFFGHGGVGPDCRRRYERDGRSRREDDSNAIAMERRTLIMPRAFGSAWAA
jgi:hypothetical protein